MSPAEFFTRYGGIILAVLLISGFIFALVRLYLYLRAKMIGRIVYSRSFSELGAYEGERITMTETIYNPTPLPLFAVNIEGYIYNGIKMAECTQDPKKAMQYFYSRFNLMPFQQVKRTHNAVCAARGYYRLETVDIYGGGKTTYIDAPAELYIYPRILPLPERVDPVNTLQGDHTTRRHLISDPFTFNGIRAYAAGDPMNSINYKATARSGGCDISSIRVNSREFCANRAYMVYLNFQLVGESIASEAYNSMMELGLSFASDIIREAAYNGHRAGFATNAATIDGDGYIRYPLSGGELHLTEILRSMARIRLRSGVSFASLIEEDLAAGITQTEVYILTPGTDENIDLLALRLREAGNSVLCVPLPDEHKKRRAEEEKQENERIRKRREEENTRLRRRELDAIERRLRRQGVRKESARSAAVQKLAFDLGIDPAELEEEDRAADHDDESGNGENGK